jgi:hypothetical protein
MLTTKAVLNETPEQAFARMTEENAAGAARAHFATASAFTPPDPYALGLAKLRAAEATPESRFADAYAARRTREFEAEYAEAEGRRQADVEYADAELRTAERPVGLVDLALADLAAYAPARHSALMDGTPA